MRRFCSVVLCGIGIGAGVGGRRARRAALSCRRTTRIGQVGSWAEVVKIYQCWYSLGGAAQIHGMGSALCVSVCARSYGLRGGIFCLCNPDGVKKWMGVRFVGGGVGCHRVHGLIGRVGVGCAAA